VSIGTWNKCGKFCTNIIAVVLYRKKVANDYLTETFISIGWKMLAFL